MTRRRFWASLTLAAGLGLSGSGEAGPVWHIRPIDGHAQPLGAAEPSIEPAAPFNVETLGDGLAITLRTSDAPFVAATIDLDGGTGNYIPLPVSVLATLAPSETICAYREWHPARVTIPAQRTVAYIRNSFATYRSFDGDLEQASVRYQILGQIVKDRLAKLENGEREILSTDIKAMYNFLQAARDLGRHNCVRPTNVVQRTARYLKALAARDIATINGALTGDRRKSRQKDIDALTEEVSLMKSLQLQASWRAISKPVILREDCPDFLALHSAILSNLSSRELIAMEDRSAYRLLLYVEDALANCVNREAEAIVAEKGRLDRESWKRIEQAYPPTDVPGMAAPTAAAIERHRAALAKWQAIADRPAGEAEG